MPQPDTFTVKLTLREAGLIGTGLECLIGHLALRHPMAVEAGELATRIADAVMLEPRGNDDA